MAKTSASERDRETRRIASKAEIIQATIADSLPSLIMKRKVGAEAAGDALEELVKFMGVKPTDPKLAALTKFVARERRTGALSRRPRNIGDVATYTVRRSDRKRGPFIVVPCNTLDSKGQVNKVRVTFTANTILIEAADDKDVAED